MEGKMVKPFNDACFNGGKGDIVIVQSEFGYHIINIQELGKTVKKYRVAILERKVEASQVTDQNIYQKASAFGGLNNTAEKFDAAVKTQSVKKKVAANINENDKTIVGLESPRELIKWAYSNEEKTISPVMRLGDKYIVAKLNVVKKDGISPFEQVKDQIEVNVRKDKKAERIIETLQKETAGLKTIEEVANKIKVPLLSSKDINFNLYSVPNMGFEPKVIATASILDPYKMSAIIKGSNGVYIISVNLINTVKEGSTRYSKMKLSNSYYSKSYALPEVLKKAADVKDKRSKFF
jgi:peptidyl-prolyl cis-trans isomerase D